MPCRLVTVTPGSVGHLSSSDDMQRCTVQYKVPLTVMTRRPLVPDLAARWCPAARRPCSPATTSTWPTPRRTAATGAPSTPRPTPHQPGREWDKLWCFNFHITSIYLHNIRSQIRTYKSASQTIRYQKYFVGSVRERAPTSTSPSLPPGV